MNTVVIYPGRFQPFHRGHGEVYKWLKDKFGNATIATSDKVEEPKSPFNFVEKKKMMMLAGVPSKDIKQVRNPYIAPEVLSKYDGSKTVLIFAVSQKDMDEDPRFSFKPTKSGKPGYLQPYAGNEHNLQPFGDPQKPKGYVVVTPTFTFKILGKPMKSASELRQQFASADTATQKKIITELFGAYDKDVHKMMKEKIKSQGKTLKQLREGIDHKHFGPMLDSFVDFASDHLGLQTKPTIDYKYEGEGRSFGGYNPNDKSIKIVTKDRHPMDIFRTLAHELVHHKQNEDGLLGKDIEKEGATGSDIENHANSEAGKIMRWYAKKSPDTFNSGHVVESVQINEGINDPGKLKAVFLAGGPGSGKDFVMNSALHGHGLEEINSDNALEHLMKKKGLDLEMPDSEREERDIVRGRAKNITKEKERLALSGRNGLIINGTADDVEKIASIKKALEDQGYETMMTFVNTSNEVSRQRNFERGKSGGRKVPDSTNKQGIPDGSPDIRQEKWELAQKNIGKFQGLFGQDRFHVIDNTKDARKVSDAEKKEIATNFNRLQRHVRKFVLAPNQNPASGAWIEQEAQKRGITNYKPPKISTEPASRNFEPKVPVQRPQPAELDQARRLGLSYYGFGRYGRKIQGKNTVTHTSQQGQITPVQQMNEDLRKWFKEKWVRFDTKGNIKGDCAREPGEGKPKCRPLASAVSMGKEERAKSARRKRREDPVANRKGKGGKPINVQTEAATWAQQAAIAIAKKKSGKYNKEGERIREDVLNEKNIPTNPQLWSKAKSLARSKFDVYPSAYANGWASKWYKSKGGGWKSSGVDEAFENYISENNSPSDREWGKPSLTRIYQEATPGQTPAKDEKKKSLKKEDNNLPLGYLSPSFTDGVGPTFRQGLGPMGNAISGYSIPIAESIINWMNKEETQNRFIDKYGDLAEQMLLKAAKKLEEAGCGCEHTSPKSIKKIKENIKEPAEMGMIPSQKQDDMHEQTLMGIMPRGYINKFPEVKEDPAKAAQYLKMRAIKHRDAVDYESQHPSKSMVGGKKELRSKKVNEESAAWQRKEGKNPEGGLNRKGIESYRREHPGSKLSMAVTTKPSKLKKGSKAANRRKSFCARMGGMPGPMKDEKGRPTRKALSLRKWNCEE